MTENELREAAKNCICDQCRRRAKCKDFTGAGSGKTYHHIYCQRFQEDPEVVYAQT